MARKNLLIPAAVSLAVAAWGASAEEPVAAADRVRLERHRIADGAYRPGLGVDAAIPTQAWRREVGGWGILLFDLDGDRFLCAGSDGLALEGEPFVVPMPEVLLHPGGQARLRQGGPRDLCLEPQTLDIPADLVEAAAALTRMRIGSGLPPVVVSPRAGREAGRHIDYLVANRLIAGGASMALHGEDPALPGYSEEGARAGGASSLFLDCATYGEALENWWRSAWHRSPMIDPRLRTVGIAHKDGVSALHFSGVEQRHLEASLPHPPDGAVGVPCGFAPRGEIPNPVPGTVNGIGCGFPVLLLLPESRRGDILQGATLTDPAGVPVAGTLSCPARPADPAFAANGNCAAFVPAAPLAPRTRYRARFDFGAQGVVEWSFTTGDS